MNSPPEITRVESIMERAGIPFPRAAYFKDFVQAQKFEDQQSKDEKTRLIELVRENGLLRQEIAHLKSTVQAMVVFWEQMTKIFEQQKTALQDLSTRLALAECDVLNQWGLGSADDVVLI